MFKTICKKSKFHFRGSGFEPCFIKGKEYLYKIEDYPYCLLVVYSLEDPSQIRGLFYESLFKEHFYTLSEIRKMKLKKLKRL